MDKEYSKHNGSPFDRGGADSYYGRPESPHFYTGASGTTRRVEESEMSAEEIEAYRAGYDENERLGYKKEWVKGTLI